MNGNQAMTNPYDQYYSNENQETLDSCCICMEDFETPPTSDRAVDNELGAENTIVVLPCKAHFFHEPCIAAWIQKQNACPICRENITLDRLKKQSKEVTELLKKARKKNPSLNSSVVSTPTSTTS